MINIAICDDTKEDIERVKQIIAELEDSSETEDFCRLYEYTSGETFIEDTANVHFDAVIMDVQLGGITGKQAAAAIRDMDKEVVICIISGNEVPCPKDFKINPYRYIMKDEDISIIKQDICSVLKEAHRKKNAVYLFCHTKDQMIRIALSDILYISKIKYGSEVHTLENSYKIKEHLKEFQDVLMSNGFGMAHNSYLVNYRRIVRFFENDKALELENGELLNISRNHKEEFLRGHAMFLMRR